MWLSVDNSSLWIGVYSHAWNRISASMDIGVFKIYTFKCHANNAKEFFRSTRFNCTWYKIHCCSTSTDVLWYVYKLCINRLLHTPETTMRHITGFWRWQRQVTFDNAIGNLFLKTRIISSWPFLCCSVRWLWRHQWPLHKQTTCPQEHQKQSRDLFTILITYTVKSGSSSINSHGHSHPW